MSFFAELKRRNVVRVGIAYVLGAWLLLQVVDFVLDAIGAPGWILQVFLLAAAIGLPVALVFAWVFELTPEGLKRESEIDRSQSITRDTGRKLDRVIIATLALVRKGIPVLLIEAEPEPVEDQRAATIHAPTLEMLADLGLRQQAFADDASGGFQAPLFQFRDRATGELVATFDIRLLEGEVARAAFLRRRCPGRGELAGRGEVHHQARHQGLDHPRDVGLERESRVGQ